MYECWMDEGCPGIVGVWIDNVSPLSVSLDDNKLRSVGSSIVRIKMSTNTA